jgi:hypothetical protein
MDDFTFLSVERIGIARGRGELAKLMERSAREPFWVDA